MAKILAGYLQVLGGPQIKTEQNVWLGLTEQRAMFSFCVHKAPRNLGCLSLGVRILGMRLNNMGNPYTLVHFSSEYRK